MSVLGGCTFQGVVDSWRCTFWGFTFRGVPLGRVVPSMGCVPYGGVPSIPTPLEGTWDQAYTLHWKGPRTRHTPPTLWTESQMTVKTLPSHNFVGGW